MYTVYQFSFAKAVLSPQQSKVKHSLPTTAHHLPMFTWCVSGSIEQTHSHSLLQSLSPQENTFHMPKEEIKL